MPPQQLSVNPVQFGHCIKYVSVQRIFTNRHSSQGADHDWHLRRPLPPITAEAPRETAL